MPSSDGLDISDPADSDAAETARSVGLTAERLFEVLSQPGNRYVLAYMLDADDPVAWYDLVEYVVETTEPPLDLSLTEYRGRVATHILHDRLPQLAELGFVEYRDGEHRVQPGETLDLAGPYLDLVERQGL
jgi:hypothetical protein